MLKTHPLMFLLSSDIVHTGDGRLWEAHLGDLGSFLVVIRIGFEDPRLSELKDAVDGLSVPSWSHCQQAGSREHCQVDVQASVL